jgi:hypothetical protein
VNVVNTVCSFPSADCSRSIAFNNRLTLMQAERSCGLAFDNRLTSLNLNFHFRLSAAAA